MTDSPADRAKAVLAKGICRTPHVCYQNAMADKCPCQGCLDDAHGGLAALRAAGLRVVPADSSCEALAKQEAAPEVASSPPQRVPASAELRRGEQETVRMTADEFIARALAPILPTMTGKQWDKLLVQLEQRDSETRRAAMQEVPAFCNGLKMAAALVEKSSPEAAEIIRRQIAAIRPSTVDIRMTSPPQRAQETAREFAERFSDGYPDNPYLDGGIEVARLVNAVAVRDAETKRAAMADIAPLDWWCEMLHHVKDTAGPGYWTDKDEQRMRRVEAIRAAASADSRKEGKDA